jgi:uncharacterized repeat protein (TIGR01451 family)
MVLVLSSLVGLAKTPAGTQIVNQGVILYEDDAGNAYTTTSNQVTIEVLPVYGISILPDGTAASPGQEQEAVAGQQVYFPYTLTNTGNTDDSYFLTPTLDASSTFLPQLPDGNTGIEIFWDQNMNGVIDSGEPLVASWRDLNGDGIIDSGEVTNDALGPLNQDEVTGLIIAYNVPAGASAGDAAYVGVDGTSTHVSAAQDVGNVHETSVIDDAVVAVTKSASPTSVDPGDTVTYTVSGENRGTKLALGRAYDVNSGTDNYTGVLIYDIIPEYGGTYFTVTGIPSGSPSGGTVIYANPTDPNTDPTGWTWSTSYSAGWKAIGYVTSDGTTNQDLAVNGTISLTFDVIVPSDYPAGYVDNYGYATYKDNQSTPKDHIVRSNDALVEVLATAGVDIADTDYLGLTPNPPDDGSGSTSDTETYTTAAAGTTVEFTNRVTNTGTADDVFDIFLDGSSTIPADWTVTFYKSDGVSPLPDTDGDGAPDIGSLSAGDSRDIVVKVTIPADTAAGNNAGSGWSAVIDARSSLNTTVSDTTTDRIHAVTQAGVDIQNRDGGLDPSPTVSAGECAKYPLDVINTGQAPDVFVLSWSGLDAGWSVVFYRDANDNGILDTEEKTPVTSTVMLDPLGEDHFIAVVCSPADAALGASTINFIATSTNNTSVTDTQPDTINVSSACAITLVPDRSGIVRPGGVVWYEHTLKNTGDQATTVNLTLTATTGWTHLLYYGEDYNDGAGHSYSAGALVVDTNADVDTIPDVPNLAAGAEVKIEIKAFAPSSVAEGTTNIATITAVAACGASADAVDVTQVVSGGLVLHKGQQVSNSNSNGITGDPGDQITYTTSYKNLSAGPLFDVTVYETIPAHTSYVVGFASGGTPPGGLTVTIEFSSDGGASWSSIQSVAVTNVRWKLSGPLPAGAESSVGVSFDVQIE